MLKKFILFFIFLCALDARSNQGIITACNDHYMKYLVPNLKFLREEVKCNLPIEIWHAGNELSDHNKKLLLTIDNTTIHDLSNYYTEEEVLDSRGWQIKAYILKTTSFEEVILMDADVFLLQDPSILLNDENYLQTGNYFFRDIFLSEDNPLFNKFKLQKSDNEIKEWFKKIINTPSQFIIPEVEKIINNQLPISYLSIQESGLVVINKIKHKATVDEIFRLNKDHKITYQYVYGDKDTFWIACEKINQPYYFNPSVGMHITYHNSKLFVPSRRRDSLNLMHLYNEKLIFIQQQPRLIRKATTINYTIFDQDTNSYNTHSLNQEDEKKLKILHKYYKWHTPKLLDKIKAHIK